MIGKIIETMKNSGFDYFGLRKDDFNYSINDCCNKSHELFQDPEFDEDDELVYPYCESGIYAGYYDAGELNGTSAIAVSSEDTAEDIRKKLDDMKIYHGKNLYLIAGNSFSCGYDSSEIIVEDATVICRML